jgi:hypothetical protein
MVGAWGIFNDSIYVFFRYAFCVLGVGYLYLLVADVWRLLWRLNKKKNMSAMTLSFAVGDVSYDLRTKKRKKNSLPRRFVYDSR